MNSSTVHNTDLLDPPSGSNSHTFGRRSRAAIDQADEDELLENGGLDRETSQKSLKSTASSKQPKKKASLAANAQA